MGAKYVNELARELHLSKDDIVRHARALGARVWPGYDGKLDANTVKRLKARVSEKQVRKHAAVRNEAEIRALGRGSVAPPGGIKASGQDASSVPTAGRQAALQDPLSELRDSIYKIYRALAAPDALARVAEIERLIDLLPAKSPPVSDEPEERVELIGSRLPAAPAARPPRKVLTNDEKARRMIGRVRAELDALIKRGASNRVPWTLLPPGTWDARRVIGHFESLARSRRVVRWDPARLSRIMSELKPSECSYGADDFDGYVAFGFVNVNAVVLDNPLVGNALYVIKEDWRSLSQLTKRELLEEHRQQVCRIVHSGDWFDRLKTELKLLRRRSRCAARRP